MAVCVCEVLPGGIRREGCAQTLQTRRRSVSFFSPATTHTACSWPGASENGPWMKRGKTSSMTLIPGRPAARAEISHRPMGPNAFIIK